MTILLGGFYPVLVTFLGRTFFPIRSKGSLVQEAGTYRGSELIAQKFASERYFWPRPSSIDYRSEASGATNRSATSKELKESYLERRSFLGEGSPNDLLYTSGSGLDPHIGPEAAHFQKGRVMKARNLSVDEVNKLISEATEERFLGFMGRPRINVFKLNRLLDSKVEK